MGVVGVVIMVGIVGAVDTDLSEAFCSSFVVDVFLPYFGSIYITYLEPPTRPSTLLDAHFGRGRLRMQKSFLPSAKCNV